MDFVKSSNENFVIDLTGNGGGDDWFAFGLLESLYTENQQVPSTEKVQVNSPMAWLGILNLFNILDYRGGEEFQKQVDEAIEGKTYQQILPYEIKRKLEEKFGKRNDLSSPQFTNTGLHPHPFPQD